VTVSTLPERPTYLRFLPEFLFRQDEGKVAYVLKAWLLALLPSFVLSGLVNVVLKPTSGPDIPTEGSLPLLLLIVAGPLVETLIMILMILGLRRLFGAGPAVVLSALLWGIGHSLASPIWGLVVWWPFLIFSIAFLTWRERGMGTAILMVTAIHGLQNGTVALLLLLARSLAG
jgi:membrane protease YdiL (CAAX protease family)